MSLRDLIQGVGLGGKTLSWLYHLASPQVLKELEKKPNLFSVPIAAMFLTNRSPVLCVIQGVKEEHSGVSVGAERKFQGRAAGCLCSIIFQLYKKNKADC